MTRELEVGNRVKYSRNYLCAISALTGDLPFDRGEIINIEKYSQFSIAVVEWDNNRGTSSVNVKNLVLESNPELV